MTRGKWKGISFRLLLALTILISSLPLSRSNQGVYAADDPPTTPQPSGIGSVFLPIVSGNNTTTQQAPDADPQGGISIFLPVIGSGRINAALQRVLEPFHINLQARASTLSTNPLRIVVVSARTEPLAFNGGGVVQGDPIESFRYLINVDNTGQTDQRSADPGTGCSPEDPGYPESCRWTSIAGAPSNAPIYTQGNQDDFANGAEIMIPDGRFLISVMADGYKLDGVHFDVPVVDASGVVTVALQPFPLPAATLQAWVFEDISPTNSAPDAPIEHGLAGFSGHVVDYLGEISTDVYGNPLCTEYERDELGQIIFDPVDFTPNAIPGTGGECLSDENGYLAIPNMGTNRYGLAAVPPDGTDWIQTTTLEGNHEWDAWVMEGSTGLDTEFVVAGEPFPVAIFGFVRQTADLPAGPAGSIRGVVSAAKVYIPTTGGVALPGSIWGGLGGMKLDKPIDRPWIALSDLGNGDTAIWIGQGDENGAFQIDNVPNGNYTLTWWDEPQNYILDLVQVTVQNGEAVDLGILPLTGWWTQMEGYVFNDANRNGKMDWQDLDNDGCPDVGEGELGVPNYTITIRKRENSLMDRAGRAIATDQCGYYKFDNVYPMTQWLIMEAYNDLYYTTGMTFQADNQPTPTTILGAGVDVSILPIIGLGGRIDWGVHSYDPTGANGIDPRNGGIAGTVSYDTTRNELDPRHAAVEDWQPGISDLEVNLYATVPCGTTGAPCDATGFYELDSDGSYSKGPLLNSAVTETWERPTGCVARNVDGVPLIYPNDQQVLPQDPNAECLEGPLMGVQFQAGFSSVDGNYGFGEILADPLTGDTYESPVAIPAGGYLVEVVVPEDDLGRPLYKVTREEDINVGEGDLFVPQVPPPACAGALHIVDVADVGGDGYPAVTMDNGITVPASTPTFNPSFADMDGSPYEGMVKPLCDVKLVELNNGKSIAPTFNFFTDVPLPGRFWGLIVDDLTFSSNPKSLLYGEKAGVPFAPVGIYDFANRLVATVESDYNGLFDVLLPSTNRINCPTPSGVCSNLYRLVGNDPGVPGQLNPNYKPNFRTISAEFEAYAGLIVPADLAPTQVGVTVQLPGGQAQTVSCTLEETTPQIFAVSQPYVQRTGNNNARTFTIEGIGFGATQGNGSATLDGIELQVLSWSNTRLSVRVRNSGAFNVPAGPHRLEIAADSGERTINGLTIHVLQNNIYNPTVYEVGPGRTYAAIQDAIDAAEAQNGADLVVVYPGQPDLSNPRVNPRGAYYENLIVASPIKLQGVGPGGFQGTTYVPGSVIDGGAFGGDTALADAWRARIQDLTWSGNDNVYEGSTIYLLASENATNQPGAARQFTAGYQAAIDGFNIRGGDQQGFPNNINQIGGGATGQPANVVTQGGAIFANAYVRYLNITNNVIENNGGAYGTLRIGTPNLPAPGTNNHNENVVIAHNRVLANGGTNLAGGIGLFAGADNYQVAHNDICGNFSAEYGGGISVYGYSPNGQIHHNRVYFNSSYDEGGGIMIAGELPADPSALSPGSGAVDIYNNLIQANLSNDDGGGIRFLMAGNYPMNVYNNIVVNNVSTHEGGGISLNDAPNVRIFNNTIMKNLTTATAITSNGQPAPAGLSTAANSALLQATLPNGAPIFSNPALFNNIFWDNRAGTRAGTDVIGLGLAGDATPVNYWDLGVADGSGQLSPTNSVLQTPERAVLNATNVNSDPLVVSPYNVAVDFAVWRNNPNFVGAILVTVDLPPNLLGDYHLSNESPAVDAGTSAGAPTDDIDGENRPMWSSYDIGADEMSGPPPALLYFSTGGNNTVSGVTGPYDNADIYGWYGGTNFVRIFDATDNGIPGGANVDALDVVSSNQFYLSFDSDTSVPTLGTVQDEDVVYY
ncbi:MAG: hypothetical protein KDD84_04550, partial [Caldilineaceae bacterium]|nr:hypothetical protein [Caldilineaceae bacterium]